jgi:CDP-diacylglycerol--glycerol-3-phosphate 3-phosphatidyltransferase
MLKMNDLDINRRPIKARSSTWANKAAIFLTVRGISPNQISVTSAILAILGSILLAWYNTKSIGLIGCALTIQGRLICNLLDGMVAVEGKKKVRFGRFI